MIFVASAITAGVLWLILTIATRDNNEHPDTTAIAAHMKAYSDAWEANEYALHEDKLRAQVRADIDARIAAKKWAADDAILKKYHDLADGPIAEVTSALVGLGWPQADSARIAEEAVDTLSPYVGLDELVTWALRKGKTA